jgi:hypothetical protein
MAKRIRGAVRVENRLLGKSIFSGNVTQNSRPAQHSLSNVISVTAIAGEQIVISAHEVMLHTVALLQEAQMMLTAPLLLESSHGLKSVHGVQKSTQFMQGGSHA